MGMWEAYCIGRGAARKIGTECNSFNTFEDPVLPPAEALKGGVECALPARTPRPTGVIFVHVGRLPSDERGPDPPPSGPRSGPAFWTR